MNHSSCNECLCTMLSLTTQNSSIASFNCFLIDIVQVTCQYFTVIDYQSSPFYELNNDSNSTFYFLQLPSNNLSQTTATPQGTVSYVFKLSINSNKLNR